jgi:hypothetical protein
MEKNHTSAGERRTRITKQLVDAHARQVATQAKLDSLLLDSLEPGADKTTFSRVQAHLVDSRNTAEQEIAYLGQELAVYENTQRHCEDFEEYCRRAELELEALTYPDAPGSYADPEWLFSTKLPIIRDMVREVWVLPDGSIRLEGYLPSLQEGQPYATVGRSP